ncbi:hypothetical protein [Sandaracinus amylolyticus]|uniref:hypothetical protein n=1 Tax=Sandaracinus amylolyticus TaxID=927083 RepID=UPI001F28BAC4|nr:hypothetical protein [Sandaracinus amylolyticus]UJR86000.1 Hypothetical protein I5071_80810 [Sandaracinus amylolyticus]
MPDERPYRAAPPDARRLGWNETRAGRATELTRERRAEATSREVVPIVVASTALVVAFGALSMVAQGLSIALAAGVAATWPLSVERIHIDEHGLVWRDRLFGSRLRLPLERVLPRIVDQEGERALLIGSGGSWHLLASGDPGDVDELARLVAAAVARARS